MNSEAAFSLSSFLRWSARACHETGERRPRHEGPAERITISVHAGLHLILVNFSPRRGALPVALNVTMRAPVPFSRRTRVGRHVVGLQLRLWHLGNVESARIARRRRRRQRELGHGGGGVGVSHFFIFYIESAFLASVQLVARML